MICGWRGVREGAEYERQKQRLEVVRDVADLLVNECEGGMSPPSWASIGCVLEGCKLAMEHKARRALEQKP